MNAAFLVAPRGCPSARDRRRVNSYRAFTLLEVLIALVIFALAAAVLGSAYVNVLNSYEVAARGVTLDEDFAHARQIVLTEPDRKELEKGGDFETADGRRATWEVEIASTHLPDVFQVAFRCSIDDPTRTEPLQTEQTFTVFRPTWSDDEAERSKLKEDLKKRIVELRQELEAQSR